MMKRFIAAAVACAMLPAATVFAAAPSAYDGQTYDSLGYTSDDPDGQFNLAVIANSDVKIVGDAMYIKGSVYSNGNIYVGDGQGNKIDGLFISGTEGSVDTAVDENTGDVLSHKCEGYIHVNDNGTRDNITYFSTKPEYEGAITDKDTSFECVYNEFEVPAIANDLGDVKMTVYASDVWKWSADRGSYSEPGPDGPKTITEDTHIGKLSMNGSQNNNKNYEAALTIDATNNDVTVVIDKLAGEWGSEPLNNPSIKVVGDHRVNIYISDVGVLNNLALNYNTNKYDSNWQMKPELNGSTENTFLYLTGENIDLQANWIGANTIYVNGSDLKVSGSSHIVSNIESGAKNFTITGGTTEVYGTVCVPNAESKVIDSGTLYGQLHTNTLVNNGAGRIIWQADAAVAKAEPTSTPEPTVAPTEAPTPEVTEAPATAEPTAVPDLPSGDEIDLSGVDYAYIFGYEPYMDGDKVVLEMAMDDAVTSEQVCAMIMRLIDQKYGTMDEEYPVTSKTDNGGAWYERGLAYLDSKGAFDDVDRAHVGPAKRGEVAKLIAFGLNLTDTAEVTYEDVADSEYLPYIKIMKAYGYMEGKSDAAFEPDSEMTRGEFCKLFNNIIGRNEKGLTAKDGTEVTAETYFFTDMNPSHWAYKVCLKATSAYDKDGYVDVETRVSNIRNKLDKFDAQMKY